MYIRRVSASIVNRGLHQFYVLFKYIGMCKYAYFFQDSYRSIQLSSTPQSLCKFWACLGITYCL